MKLKEKIGCGAWIVGLLILIPIFLFFTPWLLMLTWNLAVCALFPTLPAMTFWIAFGVNIFLNIVAGKFKATISNIVSKLNDE